MQRPHPVRRQWLPAAFAPPSDPKAAREKALKPLAQGTCCGSACGRRMSRRSLFEILSGASPTMQTSRINKSTSIPHWTYPYISVYLRYHIAHYIYIVSYRTCLLHNCLISPIRWLTTLETSRARSSLSKRPQCDLGAVKQSCRALVGSAAPPP